jgi:hypothetical protein
MLDEAPLEELTHVADFQVICPEPGCGMQVNVGVLAKFVDNEDGRELGLQPELTDVWAHFWTHNDQ